MEKEQIKSNTANTDLLNLQVLITQNNKWAEFPVLAEICCDWFDIFRGHELETTRCAGHI